MADAVSGDSTQAKIDEFRKKFIDRLPYLADEFIDSARAENTPDAYKKLMDFSLKVVEGLEVDKRGAYDNLPMVNVYIGSDVIQTKIAPQAQAPALDVVDVQAKAPSDNFPFPAYPPDAPPLPAPPETSAVFDAFAVLHGAASGEFDELVYPE